MKRRWFAIAVIAACALSACAGGQKVPDWSVNAVGHVERFAAAYLRGDSRVAGREFHLARAETARTGRQDLVARVELNRCAVQVASLDFVPCSGFDAVAVDATQAERAYARYLAGQARAADVALLPAQHRAVAMGGGGVAGIDDPLARLISAAVMLRQQHADPALDGLLSLVERDVAAGRNVGGLPAELLSALREAAREVEVDLEDRLEGDVAI